METIAIHRYSDSVHPIIMKLEDLFNKNFYIFPVVLNSKKPAIHNWEELAVNNIKDWNKGFTVKTEEKKYFVKPNPKKHTIGIVTKFPLVVIDIDNRNNFIYSADLIKRKLIEQYNFPLTFTVFTKNKGYHLYYYLEDETYLNLLSANSLKVISNQIDFKIKKSYVLAPVSSYYTALNSLPISVLSNSIIKFFTKRKTTSIIKQPNNIDSIDNNNSELVKPYILTVIKNSLEKITYSILGEINNTLFNQTANIASFIHYNIYTAEEAEKQIYNTILNKAKKEKWNDWEKYKIVVSRTIDSGIRIGLKNPKYISTHSFTNKIL